MGQQVERIGFFDNDKLMNAFQISFHHVPVIGGTVGYLPKGFMPDSGQLEALKDVAAKNRAIFIKLEPNVYAASGTPENNFESKDSFMLEQGAIHGKALFTKYNFHLDLNPGADKLFEGFKSKTRYNVRLAMKKGVNIIEDTAENGMETDIRLMEQTTARQKFFSHTPSYYRTMWKIIGCEPGSMLHIFHAVYREEALVAWIIFLFNGILYYPYGASSDAYREVMASNLIMWNSINYGIDNNCSKFDLWGSLGPDPDPSDPWCGFHRFKEGYNPVLMENLGTYDLVYNKLYYNLFNFADKLRWLKLRTLGR
jgi:lipid II:glycine glycyltransferase (peptidoglycan interpeptide bridge formation enzyme)